MDETGRHVFVPGSRMWRMPGDQLLQIAVDLDDGMRQGLYENPDEVQEHVDWLLTLASIAESGN